MLSGVTQHCVFPRHIAKKWKYTFKYIFYLLEWGSNPQPVSLTITLYAPAPLLSYITSIILYFVYLNIKSVKMLGDTKDNDRIKRNTLQKEFIVIDG